MASFTRQVTVDALKAPETAVAETVAQVVREHARFVFRVAYSVLRHHHDAEDVAQETFVRVLGQRHRLHEIDDLRAWIGTIAWRLAVERRRAPRGQDLDLAADRIAALHAGGAGADDLLERAEMATLLWGMVATLPPDLRDALTLSTVQELTSAEAGTVLGVPEGTVRNRVHRAKQMLQAKLAAVLHRK